MKNLIRHLRNNLGTAILALLLGFVIWIAATLEDDPFTDQQYSDVPISVTNQPPDTVLYEPIGDRVTVMARAQSSVLADLGSTDFEATMDLFGVEPGVPQTVPVQVLALHDGVRIQSVEPAEQTVHLEAIITITQPVTIEVAGQVAQGYRSFDPVITPNAVTIRGAKPEVESVVAVVGSVDVEGAREDVIQVAPVVAVDADAEPVFGVELTPGLVEVQVSVRRRVGYKPDVEVVPDLRGIPASGYRLGSVQVDPQTVTLAGLPTVLEELPGFVETLPISVTGATADLVVRTALTLPTGVAVYGGNIVGVTVEVFPIQSSRAMTATVEVQDLAQGLTATPSPDVVDVILEGADTILSELHSDDLRVVVDVDGYSVGVHRVEPDVLVPDGIAVVSVIPETIEVVVVDSSTATPSATITPSVTITPTGTSEP